MSTKTANEWRKKQAGLSLLALATMLAWAGTAQGQTAPAPDQPQVAADDTASAPTDQDKSDIVVTGTLLRGVAPTGTNVISVNRDTIVARGVSSSNDLLAKIPQIGNFGTVPTGTGDFSLPIVRPNIRNLGASGGTTTLVLMNGRRLVGAGVLQTTVDPSIIPPDVIERVEIVPDGGSAIYGSDAIGGVVNFITRKRFDGVSANARYGFADNYTTYDGNLTIGKDWGSGSLFASYAYAWHNNILGKDRDYVTANHAGRGGTDFRIQTCALGNITAGGINYALPGLLPNTANVCEPGDYADIYPREERHSVFASFTQDLNESINFSATAYWSRRDTTTLLQQATFTGTITPLNPFFRPVDLSLFQNVAISFADVFGNSLKSTARFESYGVAPGFAIKLGGGWQLRAEANLGRSYNVSHGGAINTSLATNALNSTDPATALNPYDLSATNPTLLAAIADFDNFGEAIQEMAQNRLILDGSLATLPGGDVRLAVGAEYYYEDIKSRVALDRRDVFTNAIGSFSSRDVKSVFGELLVPLVGNGNSSPGLRGLQLSGSIRYDDYNDVGGTTNPKIGLNYKPFDDLTLRGNWGTSFHAPSLADTTSTADSRAQIILFSPYRAADSSPLDLLRPTIVLAGGNPDLRPERADTWSAGFDWKPAEIPGLVASATYWNVKFRDMISVPPFLLPQFYSDPNYKPFYITNPTLQQALDWVGNRILNGAPSIQSLYVGTSPYVIMDARRTNLGSVHTDGIDFNLAYTRLTHFGAINANFAGTYTLNRKSAAVAGGPFTDNLDDGTGRLAFVATLGGKFHDFMAQATLNHRSGYPILGVTQQTHVSSFDTVDLFFGYDLGKLMKNAMLTVNIDNVFDQDPPYLNSLTGYTNGSTLGRLVSFGIRTKF